MTHVQLLPFMRSGKISNAIDRAAGLPRRVVRFYVDGFRSMTVGRSLWALIIIKVAILFLVFKLFFFRDELATRYDTDSERADAVRQELVRRSAESEIPLLPARDHR